MSSCQYCEKLLKAFDTGNKGDSAYGILAQALVDCKCGSQPVTNRWSKTIIEKSKEEEGLNEEN